MKSIIVIEHGKKTCAVEPGKFCRFMYTKRFGTEPVCHLFGANLFDVDGWVNRCPECLTEFGEHDEETEDQGAIQAPTTNTAD